LVIRKEEEKGFERGGKGKCLGPHRGDVLGEEVPTTPPLMPGSLRGKGIIFTRRCLLRLGRNLQEGKIRENKGSILFSQGEILKESCGVEPRKKVFLFRKEELPQGGGFVRKRGEKKISKRRKTPISKAIFRGKEEGTPKRKKSPPQRTATTCF